MTDHDSAPERPHRKWQLAVLTLVGMALPLEQNFIAIAIPALIALIAVGLVNQKRSASAL